MNKKIIKNWDENFSENTHSDVVRFSSIGVKIIRGLSEGDAGNSLEFSRKFRWKIRNFRGKAGGSDRVGRAIFIALLAGTDRP